MASDSNIKAILQKLHLDEDSQATVRDAFFEFLNETANITKHEIKSKRFNGEQLENFAPSFIASPWGQERWPDPISLAVQNDLDQYFPKLIRKWSQNLKKIKKQNNDPTKLNNQPKTPKTLKASPNKNTPRQSIVDLLSRQRERADRAARNPEYPIQLTSPSKKPTTPVRNSPSAQPAPEQNGVVSDEFEENDEGDDSDGLPDLRLLLTSPRTRKVANVVDGAETVATKSAATERESDDSDEGTAIIVTNDRSSRNISTVLPLTPISSKKRPLDLDHDGFEECETTTDKRVRIRTERTVTAFPLPNEGTHLTGKSLPSRIIDLSADDDSNIDSGGSDDSESCRESIEAASPLISPITKTIDIPDADFDIDTPSQTPDHMTSFYLSPAPKRRQTLTMRDSLPSSSRSPTPTPMPPPPPPPPQSLSSQNINSLASQRNAAPLSLDQIISSSILDYIRQCELYNLSRSRDPNSSPDQVMSCRVKSTFCHSLYADIESRIRAASRNVRSGSIAADASSGYQAVETDPDISSYCLWSS